MATDNFAKIQSTWLAGSASSYAHTLPTKRQAAFLLMTKVLHTTDSRHYFSINPNVMDSRFNPHTIRYYCIWSQPFPCFAECSNQICHEVHDALCTCNVKSHLKDGLVASACRTALLMGLAVQLGGGFVEHGL